MKEKSGSKIPKRIRGSEGNMELIEIIKLAAFWADGYEHCDSCDYNTKEDKWLKLEKHQ